MVDDTTTTTEFVEAAVVIAWTRSETISWLNAASWSGERHG
jgi:hypothetical protein